LRPVSQKEEEEEEEEEENFCLCVWLFVCLFVFERFLIISIPNDYNKNQMTLIKTD